MGHRIGIALIIYLVMRPDPQTVANGPVAGPATLTPTGPNPAGAEAITVERREVNDLFAMGDPDAPVAMVVFSDYRCPFCAKFSRDTEPELIERFVENGTLRIEWRDFPIFGDQSIAAARAGRAAGAQGKFWEYNKAVFAESPERGHANLTDEVLIGFAEKVGIPDIDRFTAELESTVHDAAINSDRAQGRSIGVPSTPAFLINNVPLLGAQPTEEFIRAIVTAAGPQ